MPQVSTTAAAEHLLLCEGDDIDDKLVYAQDLIVFLTEQVGAASVDTVLMAPEPTPGSTPMHKGPNSPMSKARLDRRASAPARAASVPAQTFYIGDEDSTGSTKRQERPATNPTTPRKNDKLFFIGDVKPVGKRRHTTKAFFIGDSATDEMRRVVKTTPPRAAVRNLSAACSTPRKLRNLLEDDSAASTACSESSLPPEAATDTEYGTPVKRLLGFGRLSGLQRDRPEAWKSWSPWACALSCTARERDAAAPCPSPVRPSDITGITTFQLQPYSEFYVKV